jgi:hypothetical protein
MTPQKTAHPAPIKTETAALSPGAAFIKEQLAYIDKCPRDGWYGWLARTVYRLVVSGLTDQEVESVLAAMLLPDPSDIASVLRNARALKQEAGKL